MTFSVSTSTSGPQTISVFLTTSTGALQFWQYTSGPPSLHCLWTREESLSDIRAASFIELPERLSESAISSADGDGGFVDRVKRQISDARDFPAYALHFIKRFVTGSYDSVSSSASPSLSAAMTATANSNHSSALYRDSFGFRKVIVAATAHGIVLGLDSSSGAVLWRRLLGLGWAQEVGGRHVPVKMFVVKTVQDGQRPQVVIITQRLANNVSNQ